MMATIHAHPTIYMEADWVRRSITFTASRLTFKRRIMSRHCIVRDLGRMSYAEALSIQESIAGERKLGLGADHLLFVEHPHVVTIGRNGRESNVLASPALLRERGVEVHESDRGGDVTYHGPGQIVAYPVRWICARVEARCGRVL